MRNLNSMVRPISDFITNPGDSEHVIFESRFNGATIELVETGRENIQEAIEAYAPYCDINYMLHRLKVGDDSVLTSRQAMYGDFSGMPDNPIDAINMVHTAETAFSRLPVEEKQDYNNDYRVWLASLFNGAPNSDTGNTSIRDSAIVTEDVKENTNE